MRVLYGAVLEPPEPRRFSKRPYAKNLSGGYFNAVSACLPLHGLRETKVGFIRHGIKANNLVCTIWGDCVEVLAGEGNVIGLFINQRKELLEFRHLEKELVCGIFQLLGEQMQPRTG
jgi:hypothetical protein